MATAIAINRCKYLSIVVGSVQFKMAGKVSMSRLIGDR